MELAPHTLFLIESNNYYFEYLFMSNAFRYLFPEIRSDLIEEPLYSKLVEIKKFEKEQYYKLFNYTVKLSGYEKKCLANYINSKTSRQYKKWPIDEKISHYFFAISLRYGGKKYLYKNELINNVNDNINLISEIIDYNELNIKNLKRIEDLTWENYLIPYFYKKFMIFKFPYKTHVYLGTNLEIKTGKTFINIIRSVLDSSYSEEYYEEYNYSNQKQIVVSEILDKIQILGNSYLKPSSDIKSRLDVVKSNRINAGIAYRAERWINVSDKNKKIEWIIKYFIKKKIKFPVDLNTLEGLTTTEKINIIISILVFLENYNEFIDTDIAIHKNAKGNIIHLKNIQSAWNNYNTNSPKRHVMSAKSTKMLNDMVQLTNLSKEQSLLIAMENEMRRFREFGKSRY